MEKYHGKQDENIILWVILYNSDQRIQNEELKSAQ